MGDINIKKLKEELEDFRVTYNTKYTDKSEPATVRDIEELARDSFYVFASIIDELEKSEL